MHSPKRQHGNQCFWPNGENLKTANVNARCLVTLTTRSCSNLPVASASVIFLFFPNVSDQKRFTPIYRVNDIRSSVKKILWTELTTDCMFSILFFLPFKLFWIQTNWKKNSKKKNSMLNISVTKQTCIECDGCYNVIIYITTLAYNIDKQCYRLGN